MTYAERAKVRAEKRISAARAKVDRIPKREKLAATDMLTREDVRVLRSKLHSHGHSERVALKERAALKQAYQEQLKVRIRAMLDEGLGPTVISARLGGLHMSRTRLIEFAEWTAQSAKQ